MASRLKLQNMLEEILGSRNVYFQPPENFKMSYPCFIYKLDRIGVNYADDSNFISNNSYSLTYVTSDPDDPIIKKMTTIPLTHLDRSYVSSGLNHYIYTIYY